MNGERLILTRTYTSITLSRQKNAFMCDDKNKLNTDRASCVVVHYIDYIRRCRYHHHNQGRSRRHRGYGKGGDVAL